MATLEKEAMLGRGKFFSKIRAFKEYVGDTTECFDSELYIPPTPDLGWKLTINLRIFYNQINPNQVMAPVMAAIARSQGLPATSGQVGVHPDYDKIPRWIKEWSFTEWNNFTSSVKAQASLWNHKFWLVPRNNFDAFDKTTSDPKVFGKSATYRPTVECLFNFEIAMHSSYAHTQVDVVNIHGPNFFRSDNRTYNSNDTTPRPTEKPDWRRNIVRNNHPVIAHEIGHSLGLPHIGQTRSLQHCSLAINWEKLPFQDTLPWIYRGGSGADVCYGTSSAPGDINNIMGAGSTFSAENGKPWLERFFRHLNLSSDQLFRAAGSWQVSTTKTPPIRLV